MLLAETLVPSSQQQLGQCLRPTQCIQEKIYGITLKYKHIEKNS